MNPTVEDEMRYRLLRYFEQHPHASQRELARELGISVGKVNYCLRALIQRGWVKMRNFRDSTNKLAYTYTLTSKGIEERVSVASRFLRRKLAEYDALSQEIERLTRDLREDRDQAQPESTPSPAPSR
ncbi:MAG TPA: MarR family EPS-associated transcriptional regulator [Thermoanaerobaculia bacterium]|nr:MarR family EPS-associated transcriptional regulator [Thermoanaerobaculia bacterium]